MEDVRLSQSWVLPKKILRIGSDSSRQQSNYHHISCSVTNMISFRFEFLKELKPQSQYFSIINCIPVTMEINNYNEGQLWQLLNKSMK